MTVTVYRSSDASAPVLQGVAGSLNDVLYACLVTGYGAKSAAGWARPYQNSTTSVYRAASGNRFCLRIDDANANHGRAIGYEVMSAHSTGTGLFPTTAQIADGIYIRKSNTADAVARPWVLVADEQAFYFFPDSGGTNWLTSPAPADLSGQFFFGDLVSFLPSDAYGTAIFGAHGGGTSACNLGGKLGALTNFTVQNGVYLARIYTQAGTAHQGSTILDGDSTTNTISGYGTYQPYPDPITGGMQVRPRVFVEDNGVGGYSVRGKFPGLWGPLHHQPGSHGDTLQGISGSDLDAYAWLMVATTNGGSGVLGRVLVETTNNWRV